MRPASPARQAGIEQKTIDTRPSCGNILFGIICYASESGLIALENGVTTVKVYNVNTDSIIEVSAEMPNKVLKYDGDTVISGVAGSSSPVRLNFSRIEGAKTGKIFPTGHRHDCIGGLNVTCINVAMLMVLFSAAELGLRGDESKAGLDAQGGLMARMEAVRLQADELMGLGDVRGSIVPKMGVLSAPPSH